MHLSALLLGVTLTAAPAYRDPDAMAEALQALAAAHPEAARLECYGKSAEGRALVCLTLGTGAREALDRRPAVLLLGAQRGEELLAAAVCLETARALLERASLRAQLHRATVYVIPHPNPDAVARRLTPHLPTASAHPWDEDGDFAADEDAPRDLDGDGVIAWMRWRDPRGRWIVDPQAVAGGETRLMRRADPARGERGVYRLAREGVDADGDDRFAEDGPGGIDFAGGFPLFFAPRHEEPRAGPYPLALPAARALTDWLLAHDNVAAAHLVRTGAAPWNFELAPLALASGRGKLPEAEQALFDALLAAVRERTGDPERAGPFATPAGVRAPGSLQDWLVHGLGIVSVSNRLWDRPPACPLAPSVTATPEHTPPQRAHEQPQARPDSANGTSPAKAQGAPAPRRRGATERAAAWLSWSDRALAGRGFVRWHAVAHPQLGEVEVGGWRPLTIETPPPALVGEIAAHEVTVTALLLERLPRLALEPLSVRRLGGGVFRIETALMNRGGLPTALLAGERNGYTHPPIVTVTLPPGARLVFGRARTRTRRLLPGERVAFRWVVAAPRGGVVRVVATAPRAGETDTRALLEVR